MTGDFAGYVYFVQAGAGGPIKIGYAKSDWRGRVKTLQTAIPVTLTPLLVVMACQGTEREMHETFAPYRLRGEWFAWCQGSRQIVANLIENSESQLEYVAHVWTPASLAFEQEDRDLVMWLASHGRSIAT